MIEVTLDENYLLFVETRHSYMIGSPIRYSNS
jgi:hypothetical protein